MKIITLVSRFIVIIAALAVLFVAFNLVSGTSSASTCIPYAHGNGSHLRYKDITYTYGHTGNVSPHDVRMNGTCPSDGIPIIANQTTTQNTITTQQQKDIDDDENEDHGKKQTHHVIANEPATNVVNTTVNTTVNNNTYNTYNSYAQNNAYQDGTTQVSTSDIQVNQQYPVGLYELQRFSVNGYCLGGRCYILDHCSVIVIQVNQDAIYCLN